MLALPCTLTQEKVNLAAQGQMSASLCGERGSLGQAGEESSAVCAVGEWHPCSCRGCLLKAGRKMKMYFVLNEK